ncbi:response regulator, partial [bacterium]|nr:response regulator [bacterium]
MKVILLVDDELLLLKALAFDFQRRGFEVMTASNGAEAWEKLQVKTVDLIIS